MERMSTAVMDDDVEEPLFEDDADELLDDLTPELTLDERRIVHDLVLKIIVFGQELCDYQLYDYQYEFAYRVIESLITNDGEEITALFSRQSGKTQTVAFVIATAMVLFPRLALVYPEYFGKYRKGVMVGVFGPVDEQAETLFSRVVGFLASETATEFMLDPEIDDAVKGGAKLFTLKKSGSFCRRQTANPRAKIESKSYHVAFIDEAQDADTHTVRKSIHPMMAFYNGSIIKTGTPNYTKGDFYAAIQNNKRRETRRGGKRNHFQFDWRYCARSNPNYSKFVKKERARLGEESDEFQLAFECRWLLERGMFVTATLLDALGDNSMATMPMWRRSPCVAGVDPARKQDSTVVTVCFVDWDHPDEFGFYDHRVLDWLEIHGDDWESQYFQILDFLRNYNLYAVGVDTQGIGDAVASRLRVLMPDVEVIDMGSTRPEQSKRWKHLLQLMQKGMVRYPAHSKARRLRRWKRFYQQMTDLEKKYEGPHLMAAAPDDETEAHDDFGDSLALACACTLEATIPEVETGANPFYR